MSQSYLNDVLPINVCAGKYGFNYGLESIVSLFQLCLSTPGFVLKEVSLINHQLALIIIALMHWQDIRLY